MRIVETGDGELPVRIGIEAGEVVVEDGDSTFATGEALNVAARLQQSAEPGEILIGPTAYGLTTGQIVAEPVTGRTLKGVREGLDVRRVVCTERPIGRAVNVDGALRRARGGARPARQRIRARRARPARAARDDLRRSGDRKEPARTGVLRGPRADDHPHRPLAALRRGPHIPPAGRDGAGGGRDLARRLARRGVREAQGGVLVRRRRRPAGPRVRRAQQRLGRAAGAGDRLGGARVGDEPRRGAAARARVRGRALGRGAAARPRRAPRRAHRRRPRADRVPRASRAARGASGLGWRATALDLDRARPAPARGGGAARRRARGRHAPARRPGRAARQDGGQPALPRGDGPAAGRGGRRRARADPGHRAGADRRPDRPVAARLPLGHPARIARRAHLLARRGGGARPGARRRDGARRARRAAAAATGARLVDRRRGGVPLPARADPGRRLQRPRERRARTPPPRLRGLARGAARGRARRGAGAPPRPGGGARRRAGRPGAGRPARGGRGRARARRAPRARPRGEPHGPAAAPARDRARAEPGTALLRRPRGMAPLGAARRAPSRWRPCATSPGRPATGRSRGSR